MKTNRYLLVLMCCYQAAVEITDKGARPITDGDRVNFLRIARQYGERFKVTDDEVAYCLNECPGDVLGVS